MSQPARCFLPLSPRVVALTSSRYKQHDSPDISNTTDGGIHTAAPGGVSTRSSLTAKKG